ncbi:MAG: hypothetical protein LBH07_01250 [Treponema sp.]|jgi:hypothetical protein|nr:hypothetical protein [Treponema sp.]
MANKYIVLIILSSVFMGCAAVSRSYSPSPSGAELGFADEARRERSIAETNFTISDKGLSREQIDNILSTKFPPDHTVSIAIMFLYRFNSYSPNNDGLSFYIMDQGNKINKVEKFVPVHRVFVPQRVTFELIQDLGIRSLCEYTLIFYSYSNRSMTFSQWISGEFKFESDIEYSLIDNRTTAIVASDRLKSSIIKKGRSNKDIEEAENEIYLLQAALLAEKLNELFKK